MWNFKTKVTPIKIGPWNNFKIIRTVPEQRIRKARHQGTKENSHIGHCTHALGSTEVK
jgi:hypothetical protein